MKINYEMIKREIVGETYLVPVGKAAHDYNGLFALSEVAGFIWDILPQCADEKEIISAVLEEYEVDEKTAENDVKEFISKLREMGIIS